MNSKGFSLLELAVALALGSFLMITMLSILKIIKQAYYLTKAQASLFNRAFYLSHYFLIRLKVSGIPLQTLQYYVAPTARRYHHKPVMALFEELNGQRIELEEGVDSVDVRYGFKPISGSISYLKQNEIRDWQRVVAIVFKFRLSSINNVGDELKPLKLTWNIYVATPKYQIN